MSYGRQMWSGHHPLRKQKSCIEVSPNKIRERKIAGVLQKQISIDQSSAFSNSTRGIIRSACETGDGGVNGQVWSNDRPESSLRILTAVKKRPTGNIKNDQDINDRLKKALKGRETRDNRINLNIFLAHSTATQDHDPGSDIESPREPTPNKENVKQETIKATITPQTMNKNPVASARRAQFNRTESIDRRPPLIRAMSAPIRPLDDSKLLLANKRKSRRRKISAKEREDFQENPSLEHEEDEDDLLNIKIDRSKTKKPIQPRPRSALGCDIVTLVSLLSSGGSDSEKEETPSLTKTDIVVPKGRAPMLRKTGKSVSFQEHDLHNFSSTSKEFSTIYRRGSVAPLAARIRSNRPPTAPPGSIYLTDMDNCNESKNDGIKKEPSLVKLLNSNETKNEDDEKFPVDIRTPKERECWKLFQKMSNRGVAVSYDTILRGMLTPTELRMIQKQKDAKDDAKQAEIDALQAIENERLELERKKKNRFGGGGSVEPKKVND